MSWGGGGNLSRENQVKFPRNFFSCEGARKMYQLKSMVRNLSTLRFFLAKFFRRFSPNFSDTQKYFCRYGGGHKKFFADTLVDANFFVPIQWIHKWTLVPIHTRGKYGQTASATNTTPARLLLKNKCPCNELGAIRN